MNCQYQVRNLQRCNRTTTEGSVWCWRHELLERSTPNVNRPYWKLRNVPVKIGAPFFERNE